MNVTMRGALSKAGGAAASALLQAQDLIWPPRCLLTQLPAGPGGVLSPEGWRELQFLEQPWCRTCGEPFLAPPPAGESLCAACSGKRPIYETLRAPLVYDEASRRLILGLKRAGRREGLGFFAAQMQRAGREGLARTEVIAPMPLHPSRLRQRGFNQAAWLAQSLAARCRLPCELGLLTRMRATETQEGKSPRERRANVAGAFKADPLRVAGRRVMLVDDVFTTGATLEAACRALIRAGANEVHALTVTRVVRGWRSPI